MRIQHLFFVLSLCLCTLMGCSGGSPADEAPGVNAATTERIANHTKGWIRADTHPTVVLSQTPSSVGAAGEAVPEGVFSISPATAGAATWKDATTLVWTPEEPLTSDTTYTGTVRLSELDLSSVFGHPWRLEPLSRVAPEAALAEADDEATQGSTSPMPRRGEGRSPSCGARAPRPCPPRRSPRPPRPPSPSP